jgi:RNA polymerase sigma-70 factor, ECF subfamily
MQDRELTDDTGPVRQPERPRLAHDAPLKRPGGDRVALHPFTADYVQKLTAGDADVELHFVEYFSSLLLVKLRFHLRSGQEVQELRQEVFVRVLRALRQGAGLQKPEGLGAYVNSVCNNVLLEYFRYKSRVVQLDEHVPEPTDFRTDPERELVTAENQDRVKSLVAELAPKDRRILKALYLDERERDSVCREFGVSRGYLRVLLHRAKDRFRQITRARHVIPADC